MLHTNLLRRAGSRKIFQCPLVIDDGGAHFETTGDPESTYLTKTTNLSGVSDSKVGTAVFKFRWEEFSNFPTIIAIGSQGTLFSDLTFMIQFTGDKEVQIIGWNSGGTIILNNTGSTQIPEDSEFHTVGIAWDLENDSVSDMYVDGNEETVTNNTFTNDTIDLTNSPIVIGAEDFGSGVTDIFESSLRFLWLDFSQKLDLSSELSKFSNESGDTECLGENGETPTGNSPDIFLAGEADTFHENKGTGGGFTENGELTEIT